MCEAKEYPKQNIIQLMADDFRKENRPKKKALVKKINRAFSNEKPSSSKRGGGNLKV